ncbi:general secretion pathway protein L [Vibrio ichthyoenteri ATCC 700023]|uniref:Type II secretion system protein L n=1 Tax=Vibrio ichthyoenteri ATCC 700023 TaxID=870968 RepID=F9S5F1_9VIBR|nr:type II secretion system protein GspL [Vibrio ichthyoenteri]EGU35893.1 general secretion pathway protein L [Vibrio ichthyoenteri ATCC 700023]
MSEYLIVRLSNNRHAETPWLVWSESQQEVIASGELTADQTVDEIASYAQARQTIVLLNSADVLLKLVNIPAGGARQFESMLPYLVEDDVAQDVDGMHFTILAKQGQIAHVAGVDREWLGQALETLQVAGFNVTKVLPDALALPDVEGISAVELAGQWLLKKQPYQALTIESDWLPMVARSEWVKEGDTWLPLQAYSPLPELDLAPEQQWQQGEAQLVMQLIGRQAIFTPINLLTGRFKPKSGAVRYLKIWRKAAIAAGVFMAVLVAQNVLQTYQAEQQAAKYRAESERIFRTVLAGKNKIPTVSYLKRELDNEFKRLSGGRSDETLLVWMAKLPTALKSVPDFNLTGLKFDRQRGEIQLEAMSQDFQAFEQARVKLEQQFSVQQGQLSKSGQLVTGNLILKAQ